MALATPSDMQLLRAAIQDGYLLRALSFGFCFILMEAAFLVAPPYSFFRARESFLGKTKKGRLSDVVARLVLVVLAAIAYLSPWSFRGVLLDALLFAAAYYSYVCLGTYLSTLRPRLLTFPLTALVLAPALIGVLLGVTIFVPLVITDGVVPEKSGDLGGRYAYRVTVYGGAWASHDGVFVEVVHRPLLIPIFEREVARKDLIDCSPAGTQVSRAKGEVTVTCNGLSENVQAP